MVSRGPPMGIIMVRDLHPDQPEELVKGEFRPLCVLLRGADVSVCVRSGHRDVGPGGRRRALRALRMGPQR